jgi:hypothetical protein
MEGREHVHAVAPYSLGKNHWLATVGSCWAPLSISTRQCQEFLPGILIVNPVAGFCTGSAVPAYLMIVKLNSQIYIYLTCWIVLRLDGASTLYLNH